MARRKGDSWWLAAMNGNDEADHEVSLSFLDSDKTYLARVYNDDPTVDTATKVRCSYMRVTSKDNLRFKLSSRGGAAVHLTPLSDKSEIKKYKPYRNQTL